jgi:hypothetical protein
MLVEFKPDGTPDVSPPASCRPARGLDYRLQSMLYYDSYAEFSDARKYSAPLNLQDALASGPHFSNPSDLNQG